MAVALKSFNKIWNCEETAIFFTFFAKLDNSQSSEINSFFIKSFLLFLRDTCNISNMSILKKVSKENIREILMKTRMTTSIKAKL